MLADIEDMIKEKLLEDLIDQMGSRNGERLIPKGLGVQIEAPDKEGLAEGLDHAKDSLSKIPEPEEGDEDDDLSRLMELAGRDDDDEDDDGSYSRGR